jgi:hypothetical protein
MTDGVDASNTRQDSQSVDRAPKEGHRVVRVATIVVTVVFGMFVVYAYETGVVTPGDNPP